MLLKLLSIRRALLAVIVGRREDRHLRPRVPFPRKQHVVDHTGQPHKAIEHDCVVHFARWTGQYCTERRRKKKMQGGKTRTARIRPVAREHRQHKSKHQPRHGYHGNRSAQLARVELSRVEALLTPYQTTGNRHPPRDIVTRHEQREQRLRCDGVDQTQQPKHNRHDD